MSDDLFARITAHGDEAVVDIEVETVSKNRQRHRLRVGTESLFKPLFAATPPQRRTLSLGDVYGDAAQADDFSVSVNDRTQVRFNPYPAPVFRLPAVFDSRLIAGSHNCIAVLLHLRPVFFFGYDFVSE